MHQLLLQLKKQLQVAVHCQACGCCCCSVCCAEAMMCLIATMSSVVQHGCVVAASGACRILDNLPVAMVHMRQDEKGQVRAAAEHISHV